MAMAYSRRNDGVVPVARLGSALYRCRTAARRSVEELSRASGGSWDAAELTEVERGRRRLVDLAVCDLVDLYGLAPVSPGSVPYIAVLDRSSAVGRDPLDRGAGGPDRGHEHHAANEWLAVRFAALSMSMGIDLTSGPVNLDAVAAAMAIGTRECVDLLIAVMTAQSRRVIETMHGLESRVVVPAVGLLVGDTPEGSLLLVRRVGEDAVARERPAPATPATWSTLAAISTFRNRAR
ncbi:MAG: helix-turn-helix transcriptional regulator [Microthrixaceae bacterium]